MHEREPLACANLPFALVLDFGKDAGLNEHTASDHDAVHADGVNFFPVVLGRKAVAPTKDENRGNCEGMINEAVRDQGEENVRPCSSSHAHTMSTQSLM